MDLIREFQKELKSNNNSTIIIKKLEKINQIEEQKFP